jgi:hypothetical protein
MKNLITITSSKELENVWLKSTNGSSI